MLIVPVLSKMCACLEATSRVLCTRLSSFQRCASIHWIVDLFLGNYHTTVSVCLSLCLFNPHPPSLSLSLSSPLPSQPLCVRVAGSLFLSVILSSVPSLPPSLPTSPLLSFFLPRSLLASVSFSPPPHPFHPLSLSSQMTV